MPSRFQTSCKTICTPCSVMRMIREMFINFTLRRSIRPPSNLGCPFSKVLSIGLLCAGHIHFDLDASNTWTYNNPFFGRLRISTLLPDIMLVTVRESGTYGFVVCYRARPSCRVKSAARSTSCFIQALSTYKLPRLCKGITSPVNVSCNCSPIFPNTQS